MELFYQSREIVLGEGGLNFGWLVKGFSREKVELVYCYCRLVEKQRKF